METHQINQINQAILRLFNGALAKSGKNKTRLTADLFNKCIKNGFILSEKILINYSTNELEDLIEVIISTIGLSGQQLNASFHKSWQKVRDANIEQLIIEQFFHYITTYGYEALGIFDQSSVYIPTEKLHIPNINLDKIPPIPLIIINTYSKKELREKILKLLQSGIALQQKTIDDIVVINQLIKLQESDISTIKNKEIKVCLYDNLGLIPSNNVEFLRFLIYKTTQKTLLIKDKETIEKIKQSKTDVLDYFKQYDIQYGYYNLAQIFYRFKPLFLAFKKLSNCSHIINHIRRLTPINHKPFPEDYLHTITSKLNNNVPIDNNKLQNELDRVNIFQKIKLMYALQYRLQSTQSIMYRIRNGKAWSTDFTFKSNKVQQIYTVVENNIINQLQKKLKNTLIYIPNNIEYAIPSTEKQFIGNIPSGSSVTVDKDLIVGVHWNNLEKINGLYDNRVDLDLSLIGLNNKFGWDRFYRNNDRSIMFSGDMTSAPSPDGASELFYINQITEPMLVFLNYFNYNKENDIPFDLFIGQQKIPQLTKNYMLDPNSVICRSNLSINRKQKILGLLVPHKNSLRFYFVNTDIGKSITSSHAPHSKHSQNYLLHFYKNTISLNNILKLAGVKFTFENDCKVNLSPTSLDKNTIINLLTK